MKTIYVKIEGIHCEHCREKITKELLKNEKIKEVAFIKNIAKISYDGKLTNEQIIEAISSIDYYTKEEYISEDLEKIDTRLKFGEFVLILGGILLVYLLIKKTFNYNIFNVIPTIDSTITYGMLVLTGLLTSIHCISMCGAINLMASVKSTTKRSIKRPILYNIGRVLSYTIVGAICGLVGSAISFSNVAMGIIIIVAALIMFLMAMSMIGILKFRLPHFNINIKLKSNGPFVIGLLNGLMPCGPLQAMQLYALSTGSIFMGALSMFLFGVGTVPLMFFIGVVFNLLKGKRKILFNKIASVLILLLSLVMLNRGLLALNIDLFKGFDNYKEYTSSEMIDGYQVVEFDLSYNSYENIILQKGVPVKMIINADKTHITGCNNEVVISEFGVKQSLEVGKNTIEFIPEEEGEFTYTCWMSMIKNTIKVVDDESFFDGQ